MSHKMYVNLQEVSATGIAWDRKVSKELLADQQAGEVDALEGVCSDAHWQGSIVREYGVYKMSGLWSLSLLRKCDRCMVEFEWLNNGKSARSYVLDKAIDMDEDEAADVEVVDLPGHLSLLDMLREEVWLAWKPSVICKPACKGLCQGCGVNLNLEACQCKGDDSDHPFAALTKIKFNA
ncbi:MAG: DUF177 domain-containing protein [Mariprofundaceae bacterium]